MATGLSQLNAKGYVVREAVWFPLTVKTLGPGLTIDLPTHQHIHYARRGNYLYVSPELKEFLHTEESATDPERPLKAICKFDQLRGADKSRCNDETS